MKLSPINGSPIAGSKSNNNKKSENLLNKNQQTSFRGGVDALTNFWQFIDNGGRALQFTVEDMTGTNIPRSIKGAMAGYKYTGKINIPAFLQEFIREFLTGPTMCVSPVAILALATRATGKSANTHMENIINLSHIMEALPKENIPKETFEDKFYTNAVKDLLEHTIGKQTDSNSIETLTQAIKDYSKADKKSASKSLDDIQALFEHIVKSQKENYKDTDFLVAKYSIDNAKEGATKFKNYVNYITSYAKDYSKKYSTRDNMVKITNDTIGNFKKSWLGKRFITVASMFFITGALMSFIPKIYTWASGGVNPNASAIYDEAKKNDGGAK